MLSARELGPNQFRFIHIDGSHRYEAVLTDIALARELAADECVIVFDDFSNLGHLGVAAAVWPSVVSSEVEPFACTPAKLYATLEKRHADAYREAVETFASEHGNEIRRTDFLASTSVTATWPAPRSLRATRSQPRPPHATVGGPEGSFDSRPCPPATSQRLHSRLRPHRTR